MNQLTKKNVGHISFRESVVTRMLQNISTSRTVLIICCSPAEFNQEETLGTLRFGKNASSIKTVVVKNKEKSNAQLKKENEQLKLEIEKLRNFQAKALGKYDDLGEFVVYNEEEKQQVKPSRDYYMNYHRTLYLFQIHIDKLVHLFNMPLNNFYLALMKKREA